MRVVSTVHKAGWDAYGRAWVDTVDANMPFAEACLYTEGFDLHEEYMCGAFEIKTEDVKRLAAFKEKHKHYKPPAWTTDVVRWSNKVFANYDALYDYDGLAVWLDCDCVIKKPISEEYVRSLLPAGCYLAMFQRTGMPTETGFVVRDCSHPMHKRFMDTWVAWLESGAFKQLSQWCDASTMDATIRKLQVPVHSLSGPYEKEMNPMDLAPLSQYIEHKKGARKWK